MNPLRVGAQPRLDPVEVGKQAPVEADRPAPRRSPLRLLLVLLRSLFSASS